MQQTLLSEHRGRRKKREEEVALIRGILNTLLTPQEKKIKIRGMFSVILWPSDEVAGRDGDQVAPVPGSAASWILSD